MGLKITQEVCNVVLLPIFVAAPAKIPNPTPSGDRCRGPFRGCCRGRGCSCTVSGGSAAVADLGTVGQRCKRGGVRTSIRPARTFIWAMLGIPRIQ